MKYFFCGLSLLLVGFVTPGLASAETAISESTAAESSPVHISTYAFPTPVNFSTATGSILVEKVTVDDSGSRLLVLIQTSKPVECFVFERRDPPSLFVQFLSSHVVASGSPIQSVGIDPLTEIRYGYSAFPVSGVGGSEQTDYNGLDYLELRLKRPVFYHIQQQGWMFVVGLDRTTTKIEVPELEFRFDAAKYEGAANLSESPTVDSFVQIALANSRLLSVARDEAELAKHRVFEARRALFPSISAKVSQTSGVETNPFGADALQGFEGETFKRKEYGVQATHPIWQSGRLVYAFREAKLNRQMALENLRKQVQDLTYEVKKAYFTLLKNQGILQIRRDLVAQGEVLKDMVRQKQKLNLTSKSEVLNVTAVADQAAYQLVGDEQDLLLSRLVIISLLNQSNQVPDPIQGELPFARLSFNVESIINWAQDNRPDVRIGRLNAELSDYNAKAARGENDFRLDASGFYGQAGAAFSEDEFQMHPAWNFGLRLSKSFWGNSVKSAYASEKTAPDLGQFFFTKSQHESLEVGLLDSMPQDSNAKAADLQFERSKAELVEASRKAEYEVRETYYNMEKAARQLEAIRQDLNFRSKDLDITREKVKLGLAELSQLMSAEVANAQAKISEQEALASYNMALAAMDRVAGAEVVNK